jgi:signal peptidase II
MSTEMRGWILAVIVAVVAADWITKYLVLGGIALGDSVAVVDGWLHLLHRRNTGVAFSMLSGLPEGWGAPALALFSLVVVGVLFRLLATTADPATRVAIVLVCAGAIGNAGDRLLNGGVTDFIFVTFFPYVFNVADMAVTAGGILLGLRILTGAADSKPAAATLPG